MSTNLRLVSSTLLAFVAMFTLASCAQRASEVSEDRWGFEQAGEADLKSVGRGMQVPEDIKSQYMEQIQNVKAACKPELPKLKAYIQQQKQGGYGGFGQQQQGGGFGGQGQGQGGGQGNGRPNILRLLVMAVMKGIIQGACAEEMQALKAIREEAMAYLQQQQGGGASF